MHDRIRQLEDDCDALERESEELEYKIKETIDREEIQKKTDHDAHATRRNELKHKLHEHRLELEQVLSTPL